MTILNVNYRQFEDNLSLPKRMQHAALVGKTKMFSV